MNTEDKPKFYYAVENFPDELKEYFKDDIIQDYDQCFEDREPYEDREPLDWNDLD